MRSSTAAAILAASSVVAPSYAAPIEVRGTEELDARKFGGAAGAAGAAGLGLGLLPALLGGGQQQQQAPPPAARELEIEARKLPGGAIAGLGGLGLGLLPSLLGGGQQQQAPAPAARDVDIDARAGGAGLGKLGNLATIGLAGATGGGLLGGVLGGRDLEDLELEARKLPGGAIAGLGGLGLGLLPSLLGGGQQQQAPPPAARDVDIDARAGGAGLAKLGNLATIGLAGATGGGLLGGVLGGRDLEDLELEARKLPGGAIAGLGGLGLGLLPSLLGGGQQQQAPPPAARDVDIDARAGGAGLGKLGNLATIGLAGATGGGLLGGILGGRDLEDLELEARKLPGGAIAGLGGLGLGLLPSLLGGGQQQQAPPPAARDIDTLVRIARALNELD